MQSIKKVKVVSGFLKDWFPRALREFNAHYQISGCPECHALLVEAREKFGVVFTKSGGDREI